MIYVDTSVALAQLLAEDRRPPDSFWGQSLVSSRLLVYEVWTRIHAMRLAESHGEAAGQILARIALVELAEPVLARALEPFPAGVRTLDALHLASAEFLRLHAQRVELATYDQRMRDVAEAMGLPTVELA